MHSQEGEERDLESTPIPFEIVSGRLLQSNPSFSSTPGTAFEDEKSIDFDVINDRVLNARPSKPSSTPGSILLALSDSFDEHSNMGAGPRGGLMKGGETSHVAVTIQTGFNIHHKANKARPYPMSNDKGERDEWTRAQRELAEHAHVPSSLFTLKTKVRRP